VVSLVPSLTESLFDLGLGDRLIGITDFCVHPANAVASVPRLGGTKSPRVEDIVKLHPDLVLANQEENRREDIERLAHAGIEVWVSFPHTVRQALDILWDVIRRFNVPEMSTRVATIEHVLDWTRAASEERRPVRVFCPVWRHPAAGQGTRQGGWFMTANEETYLHDLLAACGGRNVFGDRQRRYPLAADLSREPAPEATDDRRAGRDTRYPRLTWDDLAEGQPEVILLPSEPYAFDESDRQELLARIDVPATRAGRVHLVDGSLLTWHGTRLARALQEIPPRRAI
jgi:ABC-type Fe3+-hydroxamate transport system substrate-binding protein